MIEGIRPARQSAPSLAALVAGILLCPGVAAPCLAWPERAVTLVTPTGAGGGSDAVARIVADRLAKRWKQPVIVANHPGADGILAVGDFLQARAGHTLLFTMTSTVTVNPLLHDKLPYDPVRDLLPVSLVVDDFIGIAAAPSMPASSLRDLVSLARSKPGGLSYAAVPGSPYLAFLAFQKRAGIELTFVPYRNPIGSITDLMEARIEVAVMPLSVVLAQARGGRLKLLAVTSEQRAPAAPDVPTAAETGYPDLAFSGGLALFAPKDMPPALRDRIADDVRAILGEPEVRQRMTDLGYVPRGTGPSELAAMLAEQSDTWAAIARAHGARPSQ